MTRRLRILAGVALFALAGYWAGKAARVVPYPPRTAFIVSPGSLGRLRRAEWCSAVNVGPTRTWYMGCGHLGDDHDPDLGCLVLGCPCRRLACLCPDRQPPGDR